MDPVANERPGPCDASARPSDSRPPLSFTEETRSRMDRTDYSFVIASVILVVIAILEIVPRIINMLNTTSD
jgi:hypothetical protein